MRTVVHAYNFPTMRDNLNGICQQCRCDVTMHEMHALLQP